MQQAERGVFDLRRGQPIHLYGEEGAVLVVAVETMAASHLQELAELGNEPPRLLLTAQRAHALGLQPEQAGPVSFPLQASASVAEILALAASTVSALAPESLRQSTRFATAVERNALDLAKAGRLVPAVLSVPVERTPAGRLAALVADGSILSVPGKQAEQLASRPRLRFVRISDAPVPLEDADQTRFMLFREENGVLEHVAILIGNPATWPVPVAVRVHSACLTGDLFGSLRCDCGEQLRGSVRTIAQGGGGVLLYLAQEGRGIGLANKLRAYTMQDQGMDTVDADRMLGFHDDERRYEAAVAMLNEIGIKRIRLYTNNPEKVNALARGGIEVVERHPLHGIVNPHNLGYLNTKSKRAGHMLDELLKKSADIKE